MRGLASDLRGDFTFERGWAPSARVVRFYARVTSDFRGNVTFARGILSVSIIIASCLM